MLGIGMCRKIGPGPPARLLPLLAAARLHERVVARAVARAGGPRGTRGTTGRRGAGCSSCSASYPMPRRSVTPGRNVSTSTSASAASRRNASAPAWLLQVDGHRAPRPVPHRVAAVVAERVAAGRLDLDHVGALLGQQQHAERSRDPPRQIEHAHPVQGTGHMAAPSRPDGTDASDRSRDLASTLVRSRAPRLICACTDRGADPEWDACRSKT